MIKQYCIVTLISLINILSVYSQPNINQDRYDQTITDNDIQVPEEIERNFDQLLADWRVKMKSNTADCNFNSSFDYSYPDTTYINRLYNLPAQMELVYNQIVRSYIDMYSGRRKASVPIFLAKSNYYFPIIEKYLDQYQVPLELKYLPIIESAFNPTIVSRAGATGLWQFMIGTGRMYDLEINSLVDERRDPVKSSEAAAKYLRDLYNIYNDWILVIAAYNCGPGNVNKAIKRSGGEKDYWRIYNYLPRETRGYVPAFIAATYIMNYPDKHGICAGEYDYIQSIDTVHITEQISMEQIAQTMNISIEDLRDLNPQYKKDIIPGGFKEYVLRLPSIKAVDFISKKEQIYKDREQYIAHRKVVEPVENTETTTTSSSSSSSSSKGSKIRYKVKRGDNLSSIASKHRVSVNQIKKWNGLKSNRISVGQVLAVGFKPAAKQAKRKKHAQTPVESTSNTASQSTEETNSSSSLLSEYFAQVKESAENEQPTDSGTNEEPVLSDNEQVQSSNRDDLYVRNTIYHKVRSGETLDQIAKKYNVSIKNIRSWNKLKNSKLKVGQRLVIYIPSGS